MKVVTLSHSSIHTYLDCPQKWKFKYVDKLPEKPRSFFSFGKSVHSALEFLYKVIVPPPPTLEAVLADYAENWISEGYGSPEEEADYRARGEQILRDYYAKHVPAFQVPFFIEYPFKLEVDGVPVRGFVDRVDKVGEDRIAIVDYKTGKGFDLARVKKDAQLTMYQMACEQLLGLKVESLTLYHLPSQTAFTVPPHGAEQVAALRSQIVSVAGAIDRGLGSLKSRGEGDAPPAEFEPRPEERKCNWCDFKPMCPVFKHLYATAAVPAQAPALKSDEKLAKLVDRFGRLREEAHGLERKAEELKEQIVAALREKDYVRAFGSEFEATVHGEERWEFADKAKVLEAIQRAGLWERILAPSAPLVQKLMRDPGLPLDLRDRLQRLGHKTTSETLRVKRIEQEE